VNIVEPTDKNLKLAANLIKKGELVAFPTETVYGLGADGLNPLAVAKIFETKERPSFNPLILHISGVNQIDLIANFENVKINNLIKKFWPGPLTIVVPKKETVPDIVTAGNETVAIRMPNHPVALRLIDLIGNPIAAPSANMFGRLSPTTAEHVYKQLGNKVKLILNGGKCRIGVESTILGVKEDKIFLLRPGGISKEEIESVIGKLDNREEQLKSPDSPGQLPYHYAPRIPIKFLDRNSVNETEWKSAGVLLFKKSGLGKKFKVAKTLSPDGNLREAAANLFNCLHDLEKENINKIFVEPVPETGLGVAIMDRLKKAVNKYL